MDSLVVYALIGVIFSFLLEKTNEHLSKGDEEKGYVRLNLTTRLILILAWPVYLMLFIVELIKNIKKPQ